MMIVWRVTQRCNLTCPFCAYDSSLRQEQVEMSAERVFSFCRVLADYQQKTGDEALVSWLGGEPMLWTPLFEIAPKLKEMAIRQSITTNATTLNLPEVQQFIMANFCELTVSVDGPSDFHDKIRGWKNGWQRINEAITTLVQLRKDKIQLKIRANIVLMHDNIGFFPELCDALSQCGIDEITFNALGGRERPDFFTDHSLQVQDISFLSEKFPQVYENLKDKGVKLCGGTDYLTRMLASAQKKPIPVMDCSPGKSFLFIDEFGKISPCCFTSDVYSVTLEEINTAEDLLDLPKRFSEYRNKKFSPVCSDCPSTQVFSKFI